MSQIYLWILAGSCLCLLEVIFPVAFVAVMMGLSAIVTAGIAVFIPSFTIQAACWLILSVIFIAASRRFVPPKQASHRALADPVEGKMLSAIAPGESGRVLYEGNSWRAECQDPQQSIARHERVYVLGRQGNTLLVYPLSKLNTEPISTLPESP